MELKNYIYMDRIGIDSLLSQITMETVQQNHIQTTNRKLGEANGNVGFSETVKKFFNADVSMSGELESIQIVDKTTTQPYEAKVQQIVEYVEKHEVLIKSRPQIVKNYQENTQNFVYLSMPFDLSFDVRDWPRFADVVNRFGYISLYKGGSDSARNYDYSDSYYKSMALNKTKIIMNMSTKKMDGFGGITSHLATLFRITEGRDIPLGVFGHIYKFKSDAYQIKPYAVWRA